MTRTVAIAAVLAACAAVPTDCPPLRSWEQSSYAIAASGYTGSGIALDGDTLDPARVDAIADAVDACLAGRGHVDRACTTVAARPGEPSCTRGGVWLLPDRAPDASCDAKGPEQTASSCPCRWAVTTQDGGRTVVVPEQGPYERLAEGLVRVATGALYPWSDQQLARCSVIGAE